ncbi:MAG: hypothetical protein HRT57_08100 [Crocinitomicaceae bacterium]|nr:hypothetical protein [Crocinitomicaceae bacterium]
MKKILTGLLLFIAFTGSAQNVIPFVDFSGYFKNFKDGFFRQVEFQRIKEFKTGDNVCAYIDFKGNIRVFDGNVTIDVANIETEYAVSDNLMVWKIAGTLNLWDAGNQQTLSYRVGQYRIMDSVVVFQDMRFNTVNAYYKGEIHELYSWLGDPTFPDFVGENIIAFRDNGNFNKVFWHGEIFDLDVWHNPYSFSGGTDILAFNDPINGTFTIFENGEFLDVEMFHMGTYRVGLGFVAYENLNGELMLYKDGERVELTNFGANYWDVRDDVVLWEENTFMYTYYNGEKIEVARYTPEDYKIKNGVIAYRNIMGGVNIFVNGKNHEITNQMESSYTIHGNSVLVELFNNSYILFKDGKSYTL